MDTCFDKAGCILLPAGAFTFLPETVDDLKAECMRRTLILSRRRAAPSSHSLKHTAPCGDAYVKIA